MPLTYDETVEMKRIHDDLRDGKSELDTADLSIVLRALQIAAGETDDAR